MAAAAAIGIGSEEFDALAGRAVALPGSEVAGRWRVHARDLCRISFPVAQSGLSLGDAKVRAILLAVDAYADQGQPGCFLNGDGVKQGLQDSRGWDVERVWAACVQLVSAGQWARKMAFHRDDDPLRMSVGFVVATGACAQAANLLNIEGPDILKAATGGRYQNARGGWRRRSWHWLRHGLEGTA